LIFLRAPDNRPLLIAVALGLGVLIAAVPLWLAAALVLGGALFIAALLEPLIGLLITIAAGLAEPLLFAAFPGTPPIGHFLFAFFTGTWLLRGLARRRIVWPSLLITLPFTLYLFAAALSAVVTQPPSPRDSFTELIKWIEMYLIAGIVTDLVRDRRHLAGLIAILFAVGVIQAGIGVWQFQFRGRGPEPFIILGDHYRAYGTLEQPNPFGGFMGLVWPIAAGLAAASFVMVVSAVRTRVGSKRPERNDPERSRRGSEVEGRGLRAGAAPFDYDSQSLGFTSFRSGLRASTQGAVVTLTLTSSVAALTIGALFLSFSRGAWLGAGAAAIVMLIFWPRRRWLGLGLAGGSLAAFLMLYNFGLLPPAIASRFVEVGDFLHASDVRGVHINDANFAIVERLAHWQAAVNMAEANPLFGVGFGNYEAAYEKYRLINWRYGLGHAHMIYLNVLAETGAVGLAAYLTLWAAVIGLTVRIINRASGLNRGIAIGLMGVWTHLATHQLLDNLYVGNIPLYLGAVLGVLCILSETPNVKREA
jgi:hypothetical protein